MDSRNVRYLTSFSSLSLSLSFEKYFHILGMMDRSKRKIFRYAKEGRTSTTRDLKTFR